MRLLDSNIIIYASKPGYTFLQPLIGADDIARPQSAMLKCLAIIY
jgi:hypothetical protein